jgi:hypothetical protein
MGIGGVLDAGPTGDEFVVGAGVFGPALAFAEGIETIGELADGFALAPNGHE